jgi:hypothetical protein
MLTALITKVAAVLMPLPSAPRHLAPAPVLLVAASMLLGVALALVTTIASHTSTAATISYPTALLLIPVTEHSDFSQSPMALAVGVMVPVLPWVTAVGMLLRFALLNTMNMLASWKALPALFPLLKPPALLLIPDPPPVWCLP